MNIYIYCNNDNLIYFVDYINSILVNYNDIVLILDYNELKKIINNINNNETNNDKIIFIQCIPDLTDVSNIIDQIYVFNTEQLSREELFNDMKNYNTNGIKIIDYSKANINFFSLLNIKNNILYIPYLVNNNEIFNHEKIYDIAHVGSESIYRNNIINNLQNSNIQINKIEGYYSDRDDLLFKYKILINIHYNENYKVFEQLRCNRCIFNKIIVITEKSIDIDYELKDYIIECEYDKLVETAIDVINNYTFYYNKLFGNFDIEKISKDYLKITNDAFNIIKL
jgi:hypothetical protein